MSRKTRLIICLLLGVTASLHAQSRTAGTVDTIVTIGGKNAYISYPAAPRSGGKWPVIMAIHGSGREAGSYDPDSKKNSPFYVHQRNLALNNDFMFVVISNGADTWGTDEGLRRLDSLYTYVRDHYRVEKRWCLWATSAGGVLLARFVKENPQKVSKALGTFPVSDLRYEYAHLKSARDAWGMDTAGIDVVNPINYPKAFIHVPYLIFHGRDDSAVPPEANSLRLQKEVNGQGGHVVVHLVPGGHSTNNWNVYNDSSVVNFLLKRSP